MGTAKGLISIYELNTGDIISVPAATLGGKRQEKQPVRAVVGEIFYASQNNDTITELQLFPLVIGTQKGSGLTLTEPATAGLPEGNDYTLVNNPQLISNKQHLLGAARAERGRSTDDTFITHVGSFEDDHPDWRDIARIIEGPEGTRKKLQGDYAQADLSNLSGTTQYGGMTARGRDTEFSEGGNRGTGKKRKRNTSNDAPTFRYDLTLDEVARIFNPSDGIKDLFNKLAADPELAGQELTLKTTRDLAKSNPDLITKHLNKPTLAADAPIEKVIAQGLKENKGYVASRGLMTFLQKIVDHKKHLLENDPDAKDATTKKYAKLETLSDLAKLSDEKFFGLIGVGNSNEKSLKKALRETLENMKAAPSGPSLGYKDVTTQLDSLHETFVREAMALSSPSAPEDLKEKYSVREPDGTRVFIHRKLIPPGS